MNRTEGQPDSWKKLDPVSFAYLSELGQVQRAFSQEALAKRLPLLLSPESAPARIDAALTELKGLARTPSSVRNPEAKKAWSVLTPFVESIANALRKREATLFVYGSLLYDDPKTLDYDVEIVTQTYDHVLFTLVDYLWQDQLNQKWEKIGPDGNFSYLAVEDLETHSLQLTSSSLAYAREMAERIAYDATHASSVLNGFPLVAPDVPAKTSAASSPFVENLRNRVRRLSLSTPIMAAEVCLDLEECVDQRRMRRP